MANLQLLYERLFSGKQLDNLKVYDDPFENNELCIELCFTDGEIACLTIGGGRPTIVSAGTYATGDKKGAVGPSSLPSRQRTPLLALR